MERRDFLGSLLAGLIGTALQKPDLLLWSPAPEFRTIPLAPSALVDIEAITKAVIDVVVGRMDLSKPLPIINDYQLGASDYGYTLNQQFSVDCSSPETITAHGLDRERYVMPIGHALAGRLQRFRKVKAVGTLEIPPTFKGAHIVHPETGLSVRGIAGGYYDLAMGEQVNIIRFDMLVAAA